jgi:hypothetical protein
MKTQSSLTSLVLAGLMASGSAQAADTDPCVVTPDPPPANSVSGQATAGPGLADPGPCKITTSAKKSKGGKGSNNGKGPGNGQGGTEAPLKVLEGRELDRLSEAELAKAKDLFKMDYLGRLSTCLMKALFLSEAHLSGAKLEDLAAEYTRYLKVTPVTIVSLANRLFTPENAFTLSLITK